MKNLVIKTDNKLLHMFVLIIIGNKYCFHINPHNKCPEKGHII